MNYRGTIAYRANLGGSVSEGFLHSVVLAWDFLVQQKQIGTHNEGPGIYPVHFMRGLSCTPSESANQIAEQFLGDWVLMLDTDHVFAADSFYEMIRTFEEQKLDILVGFTQKRVPPYHPVLYKTDFDAFKDFETIFPGPIERQQLFKIDSSGAACLMVRRAVFDRIKDCGERPFDCRKKWNAKPLKIGSGLPSSLNPIGYDDLPKGRWMDEVFGEDTSFFWRGEMLGFQAWCAPWVKFHHLATVLVTEEMIVRPEIPT